MDENKNCRRIYIRHADKEYANGDANLYKHDPGITNDGVEKTRMVANYLIEQWGPPTLIIVSPYRRTRETAEIMNLTLKNKVPSSQSEMVVDTDISEYLGNHRGIPIDVTDSTLIYEPPHPETFLEMRRRVKRHHKRIRKYIKTIEKSPTPRKKKQKQNSKIIWIVTHGLIIKQVASLIGIKMAKEFPPLTCLSIIDGETITKSEVITFKNKNETDDSPLTSDEDEMDIYPKTRDNFEGKYKTFS
jgi:phosphohistidine phosphatase SixA